MNTLSTRFKIFVLLAFFVLANSYTNAQCVGSSVTLGADQYYCAGTPVTLTPTVSNAPTGTATYSWTFQSNPISPNPTGTTYTIPANQSGTYAVTITYGPNCVITDEVVIGFLPVPTIGSNQCISTGNAANLSVNFSPALPSGVNATYAWTGPNGFTSSSSNPSISSFNSLNSGSYNVTVSFNTSSSSTCTYNLTTNLYLTPSTPSFSIPSNGCPGTNYSPTGFTVQPNTSYSWSISQSSNSTGLNSSAPVFNFTNSGINSITVTATQNGCSSTSSSQGISILNLGLNDPDIAPTSSPNSYLASPVPFGGALTYKICGSNNVSSVQISNFPPSSNNSATQYSITWGNNPPINFANGSSTTQSILIGNNPFTISASYGGCTTSINYNIYVGSNPYVSVGVGNSTGLCPGQNVIANITPVGQLGQQNSPGTTYSLYFSNNPNTIVQTFTDLTSTTAAQPVVFNQSSCGNAPLNNCYPSQANVYYAYVVATNACDNSCANSPAITINDKPDANFTVSKSIVCPNSNITITNTGTNGNTISGSATSGYSCSINTKIKYVISPNSGFTVVSGDLGGNSGNFNNWTGTNTVVLNFTSPGTYTIKQYAQSNNCGSDSIIKTICVINPPISVISPYSTIQCSPATLSLSSNSILPTCGTTPIPVAYLWSVTNPTGCSSCSNTISSPTSANSNFSFTNNSNSIQTYTVNLSVTPLDPITNLPLSGPGCSNTSSIPIQVYPSVQITPITTCNGTLNWNLANQVNVPSTFTWQAADNAYVSGETTTSQSTSSITDVLVNNSTTAQTVTYTVNAVSVTGSCTATNTFTVNLVTPLSVQALTNQTICVGGGLSAPLVLNYSGGSGSATFSWSLNSSTSQIATTASYSPPSFNTVGSYLYTGTVFSGPSGCVQTVSQSATITVVADPTITTQPINASYCQNASPVTPLSVIATGGTGSFNYQWYSNLNNTNSGGQSISGANLSTFTPPNSSIGNYYYYCIITQTGLNCSVVSNVVQVVVNSPPTITSQPQNQTICVGGTLTTLNVGFSGGTANPTYQWYSNTTNANTGGTLLSGETNANLTLPATLNGTASNSYYYCVINFGSASGCSVITSNAATISVLADPTFSVQPIQSQTICQGGSLANPLTVVVIGGSGNSTYQWYTVNGTTYNSIANSNSANYNPSIYSTVGNFTYAVSVTQTVSGCASTYSTNAEVIVAADPTVSITSGANYCQNASTITPLTVSATNGNGSAFTYQWFSNSTNTNSGGIPQGNSNSASFSPPVNATGTLYYYCIVTNAPSSTGCSTTSNTAAITVNAGPSISTPPQSQAVCAGGTLSALNVAYTGGTGSVTYQWYSNATNTTSGGTPVGTSSSSYALPSTLNASVGTFYYYCELSFGGSGGCSQITSSVATINVVASPIVTAPNSQTICTGGNPLAMSVSASGGINSSYSYQWYNASGAISTANSVNYSPPSSAGTYYCVVSILPSTSGCSTNSANATVTIEPDPTISAPQSANYCQNAGTVAALSVTANGGISSAYVYQWYSNTNNNTSSGTAISAANGGTSASYTPPVNNTGTLYYFCVASINPSSTTGCSVTSDIATITVNAGPTITTPPQSQAVCVGGTLSALNVAYTGGTGSVTYQWYSNATNTTSGGTPVGTSSSSYALPSTLNASVGTFYYYCELSFGGSGGCSQITSSVATINVVASPIVTAPNSQTICTGGNPLAMSVSASGGINSSYSYQWYNASGAISTANSVNYSPPSSAGTYYCVVSILPSTSGCSTNSANATVTIEPDPTISAPQSANYCQNAGTVAALSVTANGGISSAYVYQWYSNTNNNTSSGTAISAANGGTSASYTPPVNNTGTLYYFCVASINPSSTTGCSVTSDVATITVNLSPSFATQPIANQTICLDGNFTPLNVVYQNGTGTPTYQWYSNTVNNTSNSTLIQNETNASYTPTSNVIGTTYYYCVATFASGGCSSIISTISTAIVVADPTISLQPSPAQTICVGGTLSNSLSATSVNGTGNISYQWSSSSGNIPGATSQTYLPPSFSTVGSYSYFVTITLSGSGCNAAISQNAVIDVIADPVVSVQPIDAAYCQNASPITPLSVSATGGLGTFSYQWYSNSSNTNNGGILIPGATLNSYTPSVSNTGVQYYYCLISQTGLNCSVSSATAAVTVNPAPTFSTQPIASQTICLNGTLNPLSVVYQNGTGVPTYQWFSNFVNSTSGGTAISGETTSTYSPPSNTVGTTYYYCVATFSSGGCTAITSTLGTVVILADPTISTQPIPSQSICVGGTIATALSASSTGGTGTISYQWSNSSGAITGATSQTFLPPSFSNTGQFNFTVTITLSGSGCDALTSNLALIDVVSDPTVSTQPVGTSYCQNGSPVSPLTVAATGGIGTFSYQWYSNSVNSNIGGTLIPLASSTSYTPPVSTVGTTYYYCVISQSGLNCGVTTNTAAIIVNPAPTFSTQPITSQTICLDGTFNALTVVYQNGTGVPTYQWFSNATSSTSNGTILPNETNATYTPPSSTVGTTYYYCVATFASGGCSAITSNLATATVVDDPSISIQPIPTQSICVGGTIANALTATYVNGTGTVTYQWSNSTGSISGATSQTYLPPAFSTVGAYTYFVTITLSGSGCNATISQNAVIDVVADPVVSVQPISASYCQNGTPVAPLTVGATGGIGNFSYQWYSSNSNSVNGGTIISGANSSTYTPSVTNIGTIYYYCVISQSGLNCSVTSNTAGIIVNQAPVFLTQPVSQTICTGGVFDMLSVSYQFGTGVPTYQWYSNTTNSYTGAVAIAGANSPTYQAPSSSTGSNFYFCDISFSFGGCSNISSSISNQVVVVDPTITTQPLPNQTICVGGTISSPLNVIVSGGTGITTYQWFQGTNQIINATQSTFLPVSFVNAGMYTYQVNINSTGVGCAALISQQVNVEVLDDPLVTSPTSAIYCQNSPVVAPLQVIVSGGAGTNNYQWYYSASNLNSGGLQIAGASTSSYLPSVSVVGTSYYYCIVTQSTPNCSNVSNNAAIQINQPPTISAQPIQSQTICEGGTPSQLQVSYINGTNSATYQWYVSNTNSNTGGAPILNETNSFYTPPTILIGSNYYYCVITFQSGGCSTLTSATAQVSVVNDPVINTQPLNAQAICQGNTINSPLNFTYSGGTGNSTIAWYLNTTPPILINGVTTSSFLPVPFNVADTFFYYATLTFDGIGCNSVSTQQAEIIVHPTPFALNLNDTIVVCNHGNLAIPLTASVTSTFVWHTTNNPAVTGESFLNQTSYSIDDSLSNNSTSPQFLTYTVTPTSFPFGCVGPDSTVTVQVQPDVILSMNPSMEICSDSPVNAILTSNIPSTFSWFVSVNNPNVTGESILPSSSPLVNDVLVNTSSVNQVVVYAVFPISIQGQCAGTAQPLLVTVKPPIQLLNPDTLTICSGQNTNINLVANTNVQFNWYASPSLNVIGETTSVVSSALINDVLLNLTNAVETVTYNVIGTSSANGCSSPVLPLYVVVNPIPEVFDANPITICNGAYLYPVSLQTTVSGGTTNWTVLNNNIGIPSNFGSNTLPGFTAINNSIITQTGQISVTPIHTNNSVTCIGNDTTLLIHVLPTPTVNSIQDIVACKLEQVPLTPLSGPVPNTVYQWVNANTTVGLNVSGIGDIPSFVGQNSGLIPISGTVSVSPTYSENNVSCQGAPIDFTITINPSPTLLNNDIEICDGTNTNILLNANISSTFLWNATINQNVYNETSTPIQTGAFINDLLVLAGTTIQTVEYNITPISTPYGCYGNETTINVLINPLPIVDFSIINPILCNQSSINFQNNSVGPLAYTWAFGDGDSSFLFNPVHEYINFGSYLVTLGGIDQITGCENQDSQTLIIHETPEPDFIQSDSIACGSLEVLFTALDLNPTWQYQWDFGDGASSNQFGLTGHQFVTSGCFDVTLVVTTPEGCTSDSTQLSAVCIYPEPVASFSIDDAVLSSLAPEVTFFNTSVHADTYLWDFGDNTTSITQDPTHLYPSDPATYVIVLTASNFIGCQDTAALTVTVFQDLAIYVPNTFTPDGDEYNQSFLPILTEGFKKETYHLTIFDRWGAVVFESKDYRFGWEGTYKFSEHGPVKNGLFFKDITCPDGTYIWKISIEVLQTGEVKEFLGHVNLLR